MNKTKKSNDIILWPLDPFNDNPVVVRRTAQFLRALTKNWKAKIQPVHVLSPVVYNLHTTLWADWQEYYSPVALKKMKQVLKTSHIPGMLSPKVIVELLPSNRFMANRLVKYGKDIGASLIVMPTHGRTGISRFLIGSFAETLSMVSDLPMITLNPSLQPKKNIETILYPTDLSRRSRVTFERVVELARKMKTEIVLYHRFLRLSDIQVKGEVGSLADRESKELSKRRSIANELAEWAEKQGVHAEAVVDEAHHFDEDAIVRQGKVKRSQIIAMTPEVELARHPMVGSTTRRVMRSARCPVWVLHV